MKGLDTDRNKNKMKGLDVVKVLIQGLVLFQGGILMVSHNENLISVSMDELRLFLKARWRFSMGISGIYEKILQFS
ncbi:hypothetical protein EUGRSUZ_B01074 [Eucalyptus grandis]|uniref:Uncharacterized protein n=2 Tax=Eucalyptus grandis TaxID=71139 RepID=A0ACC3LP27_EUCGR|nr:hypothetical protein EUGRSUZ_B01074 [Eucalyptus grandis]